MKGGPARWIAAVFLAAGLLAAAAAYGYLMPMEILPPPRRGERQLHDNDSRRRLQARLSRHRLPGFRLDARSRLRSQRP